MGYQLDTPDLAKNVENVLYIYINGQREGDKNRGILRLVLGSASHPNQLIDGQSL